MISFSTMPHSKLSSLVNELRSGVLVVVGCASVVVVGSCDSIVVVCGCASIVVVCGCDSVVASKAVVVLGGCGGAILKSGTFAGTGFRC